MPSRVYEMFHLHRRPLLIGGGFLVGLLILLAVVSVAARVSGANPAARDRESGAAATESLTSASPSSAAASDVPYWDAMAAMTPAVSKEFPALPASARTDPGAFARAFATELFTRNYANARRTDLLAWAQYENAPLRSPNYPRADWTKVLIDSLADPTWDQATETPIPAEGPWLALAQERTTTRVESLNARVDPQWEQSVANGYEPSDPLTTVWDVSLRLVQVADAQPTRRFDVSLAIQLGTSPQASYGVAATNNYVIREES